MPLLKSVNMTSLVFTFTLTAFLCVGPCPVCSNGASAIGTRPYYVRPQPFGVVTQPSDEATHMKVLLMSNTTMKCEVDIQPIVSGWWPHLYWRHNGSTVNSIWPIGTSIDTNFWNSSVLHTPYPGSYQCVVDDGSFILMSRVAQITLKSIYPDRDPLLWHSVGACLGAMLHLPCQPHTTDYQAQVIWRRNGIVMQDSPRHIVLQPNGPGDLVIYNFSQQDIGNYSCSTILYSHTIAGHLVTQSNDSCTNWSDIQVVASREYIQQGENLFLVCLTRHANAKFSWVVEGAPLKTADTGVLSVLNSSESSLGNYTCLASTEDGLPVTSASIIVKPFKNVSLMAQPVDRWLKYNETTGLVDPPLTLTRLVLTGSPPIVTTWFHNGKAIQSNGGIVTIYSEANASQAVGVYQCFVKNLHSEARQTYRVLLYRKPNPPGIVTYQVLSSGHTTRLNLTWLPAEDILGERRAAQYVQVTDPSPPLPKEPLASRVSSTTVDLEQHYTYQFYIVASTTDTVSESQLFLYSSKGNASKLFTCCNPILTGNGSLRNYSCEPEYTGANNTVKCAFNWALPPAYENGYSSTITIFCPNEKKRQQTVKYTGISVNATIEGMPCNTKCMTSISAEAWDITNSNLIIYRDSTNQTIQSPGIAPAQPAVIKDFIRSSTAQTGPNCTGTDVGLSVYIPSQTCGDPQWYSVNFDNTSNTPRWPLSKLPNGNIVTLHVPLEQQWMSTSLSLMYGNSGGGSPSSNTVQVPAVTTDNIKDCMDYVCQQKPTEIVCSLSSKAWTSQSDVHFNDVNFTVFDCNMIQTPLGCSLEIGCQQFNSDSVSLSPGAIAFFSSPDTCHSHTYCIVAAVSMESGEPVYFNKTTRCDAECLKDGSSQECPTTPLSTTSTPADTSSQDTSYIIYALIGGVLLLFVILVIIVAVIVGYCVGRKKQNSDVLESLRTISSLQESNHGLSTSAESRHESLQDGNQYLQSTVCPDDTTQFCQVNEDDETQPDLSSCRQWVEDQQRRASGTVESEESDCADESRPLLDDVFSSPTTSPRPNRPEGSSQSRDVFSSDCANSPYVDKPMTMNFMQQQQPLQSPGPHQTYVELQSCGTRTRTLPPNPETSTSFTEASGQPLTSASAPYIAPPILVPEDAKKHSRPRELVPLEQPLGVFARSPLATTRDRVGLRDGYVQSSISPPVAKHITGGYISMPHSPSAVETSLDHSVKSEVVSPVRTAKPDVYETPESPIQPMSPWTPPSLYGVLGQNPGTDSQQ